MRSACLFTWTLVVAAPGWALAETPQEDALLQAVVEYADNVLRFGRDERTPLFADGLHVVPANRPSSRVGPCRISPTSRTFSAC